ncbi:hypothetical protein [Leifsonia aquatica]|uniref:hypothetical protein n=1 Tax=Leifsonia aquatica TaxID=144185 RepID=UPI0013B37C67|nr:hypothetical protein [Leifsonia aquatica]
MSVEAIPDSTAGGSHRAPTAAFEPVVADGRSRPRATEDAHPTEGRRSMFQPATSGVAIVDAHGGAIRAWKTAALVVAGVMIAGLVAILILLLPASYGGWGVALLFGLVGILVLLFVFLWLFVAVWHSQAEQRNDLSDALTRAGHPGVDVRRLQAGRPVPSPQNLELRLRRERDDTGRRWLLVDAYAFAPHPAGRGPSA